MRLHADAPPRSALKPEAPALRAPAILASAELWNRKLHSYVGLALLPFTLLFTLTGLLLNHPKWRFAEFWPGRKESTFRRRIERPSEPADLAKAQDLMRQLGVTGEIEAATAFPQSGQFDIQVVRPGRIVRIRADLDRGTATVHRTQTNAWGVLHMLHTFSGVRAGTTARRDWALTMIWSASMDALAIALVFLVLSSLWMWYRLGRRRRLGLVLLAAGLVSCGVFVAGLPWIA